VSSSLFRERHVPLWRETRDAAPGFGATALTLLPVGPSGTEFTRHRRFSLLPFQSSPSSPFRSRSRLVELGTEGGSGGGNQRRDPRPAAVLPARSSRTAKVPLQRLSSLRSYEHSEIAGWWASRNRVYRRMEMAADILR